MLAELGVRLVEIGHAERRRHFGEDDAMVTLKTQAADDAGLTPLLCVGETERGEPAAAADYVYRQIESAVDGEWNRAARLVVAYEPVWAIGAAEPAAAAYVSDVVRRLRGRLATAGCRSFRSFTAGRPSPDCCPRSRVSRACSWAASRTTPRTSGACSMRHCCSRTASPRGPGHRWACPALVVKSGQNALVPTERG